PGTPSPTGGKLGNGCDYYTGDYVPTGQSVADGIHVNLPPAGTSGSALANYDGPGVYCQNASNPNSPPNFVPWDGSMMPSGLYVLYGVGMQLPSSSATMTYTCQNSGDTYSSTTGTCNNAQGKPQADAAWGQCSGGGVNATGGVTIYVMPSPASGTNQVQLTPYGGTGSTCFAITAPQYTQIEPSSCLLSCVPLWTAPTNFSSNYAGVSGLTLASDLEGMAIWVSGSMSSSVSDSIGPNASIAINGAVYDPARTLYVGATSSGVAGTSVTTLTGTGSTLNASGATNCSQVEASQVTVKGPANVDLAFCTYTVGNTSYTYIRNPDYNYLGSVELVQ
ncbi:MAG TPA: hypothetical protein VME41_13400, partial [Stellaceae bacterium]|nr:hypothetical protein [Stellaceae bacterium]